MATDSPVPPLPESEPDRGPPLPDDPAPAPVPAQESHQRRHGPGFVSEPNQPAPGILTEPQLRDLAAALHAAQVDKAGRPYIEHLERVARNLKNRWPDASLDEISAAWLHDALEDTDATEESLLGDGVTPEAIRIIRAVTRPEGSVYLAWIGELAAGGDRSVLRVKLADNQDKRDPARVAALPGAAELVAMRYEPARLLLEAALARRGEER